MSKKLPKPHVWNKATALCIRCRMHMDRWFLHPKGCREDMD